MREPTQAICRITVPRTLSSPRAGQRLPRPIAMRPRSRRSVYPKRPKGRLASECRTSGVAKPPTSPRTAMICELWRSDRRQQPSVVSPMRAKGERVCGPESRVQDDDARAGRRFRGVPVSERLEPFAHAETGGSHDDPDPDAHRGGDQPMLDRVLKEK